MALSRTALLVVGVVAGVVLAAVAAYAGFGLLLVSSDRATYYAAGQPLGADYDAVLASARDAGYDVTGPLYVNARRPIGVHPDGVADLDARYGDDYRLFSIGTHYSNETYLWVDLATGGGPPRVGLGSTTAAPGAIQVPPRDWLADRIAATFAVDDATAGDYADRLARAAGNDGDVSPSIPVDESLRFADLYASLRDSDPVPAVDPSRGEGFVGETFETPAGAVEVTFVVRNSEVVHTVDGVRYVVTVDRAGGVRLEATTRAGREVPEDVLRAEFRDVFADLGLDPDAVDRFEFDYSAGNW